MTARLAPVALLVAAAVIAAGSRSSAKAILKDAAGRQVGTAAFTPAKDEVRVSVEVAGLPPGRHGIHIHAAGKCEPPDFKTAGAHLNPQGKHHGLHNPEGAHAGDLPNLEVGPDGTGKASFAVKGVTLAGGKASLLGGDGTALVVHADPDDEMSDPAGNSGARIACGVIEKR